MKQVKLIDHECSHAQNRIMAELEGHLDEAGRAELNAHLKSCSNCRASQDQFAKLHGKDN